MLCSLAGYWSFAYGLYSTACFEHDRRAATVFQDLVGSRSHQRFWQPPVKIKGDCAKRQELIDSTTYSTHGTVQGCSYQLRVSAYSDDQQWYIIFNGFDSI